MHGKYLSQAQLPPACHEALISPCLVLLPLAFHFSSAPPRSVPPPPRSSLEAEARLGQAFSEERFSKGEESLSILSPVGTPPPTSYRTSWSDFRWVRALLPWDSILVHQLSPETLPSEPHDHMVGKLIVWLLRGLESISSPADIIV